MSRQFPTLGVVLTWALVALCGCQPQQPFYFHDNGSLTHYRGMATEIEYPDACVRSLPDVEGAIAPLTLSNPEPKELWDLTLEESMRNALTNSKVMKFLGGAAIAVAGGSGPAAPEFLVRGGASAPTIYEPGLSEADPRAGVEAALSAFDAQFSTTMSWGKLDTPQNVQPTFTNFINSVNIADTATFQARLQKTDAAGGTVALTHNVQYLNSNNVTRLFPSDYNVNVEAEIRQPLLAGAGVEYNRIAGPLSTNGKYNFNGVMIARLNTDIALAAFEANVRNLVSDVETAYWELYFTYRNLDAVIAGRNSALETWRRIYALYLLGAKGGEADREAQAREQYFLFRSSVERALASVYSADNNLRYIMGIAASDGRLIRPVDEPTTAKIDFDWCTIHNEALVRSVELREQRWTIKRRELELIASKNYLLPQLDAVARYRWLGLGNDLIARDGNSPNPFAFGYNNMLLGSFQEWTAGFEFQMPLGFRREMAGVRHAQLQLTRDRAVLQEQELELSHQLAHAVRDLDANLVLSKTNFNRRIAAKRQVEAVQAAYDTGTVTIDVLLNAQRLLAQAESDYYRSLVDYNKSITLVHLRKGSLLEYNGVVLAEGPWPGKAYFDACKLARARDAAHYIDYGVTRPSVVSRGAYTQFMDQAGTPPTAEGQAPVPTKANPETAPESVPLPAAEPPAPTAEPLPAAEPAEKPATKPIGPQAAGPKEQRGVARAASPTVSPALPDKPAVAPQSRTYALEAMNLGALAGKTDAAQPSAAGQWSAVRPAGYVQPAAPAPDSQPATGGWTSAKADARHESVTNPPSAEPDRSAAGWKRADH